MPARVSDRRCLHCSAACDGAYCCVGCAAAHDLIVGAGLSRWQALADRPLPKGGTPTRRPWLDGKDIGGGVDVGVQGITCGACVFLIEKLGERRGLACRVNPGVGVLTVSGADVDVADFFDDVETLGYRLRPPTKDRGKDVDGLVVRAGITAAAAMVSMSFSFSRYLGLAGDEVAVVFFVGEFVAALVAVVVGGSFFFSSAWRALRLGLIAFDLPVALGIALSFIGSVVSAVLGKGDAVFFDSVAMFIAFMIGGRLVQRALLQKSRAQLLDDTGLESLPVVRIQNGVPKTTSAAQTKKGDRLLVRPGDAVVVDSVVEKGSASFSLAWINGEPEPHTFGEGDAIKAGACHDSGPAVVVRAEQDGVDSALASLLSRRADDDGGSAGGFARFSGGLVVFVLVTAVVAFVGWASVVGAADGLRVATTVLVVTCPCAFGLALPLLDELALARLRRCGVYVRRSGFFERLARVRHVVVDKTGTVTNGALVLTPAASHALSVLDASTKDALFQLVARSAHPKSRALTAALGLRPLDEDVVVIEQRGRGLTARVRGRSLSLVTSDNGLGFFVDGVRVAVFTFDEALQDDARAEIAAVKARGLSVHMASGDDDARARVVARALGIDDVGSIVKGGLSPDDKAVFVDDLGGDVLYVGDGINDAKAFASASVAGTPALARPQLPARADFYVTGGGTGPLSLLIDTARAYERAARVVVVASVVFNVVTVAVALAGQLSPFACALLMPPSSVGVVLLARLSLQGRSR